MTLGKVERVAAAVVASTTIAFTARAETPEQAVCAVQQAVVCSPYEPCERTLPGALNLPALMMVNHAKGVIETKRESGEIRESKIASSSTHPNAVVLQGNDKGAPWGLRIDTEQGRFVFSGIKEDQTFAGFGVCSYKILN